MTQTAVVVQGRDGLLSTSVHENVSIVKDAPIPEPSGDEALVKMLLRWVRDCSIRAHTTACLRFASSSVLSHQSKAMLPLEACYTLRAYILMRLSAETRRELQSCDYLRQRCPLQSCTPV